MRISKIVSLAIFIFVSGCSSNNGSGKREIDYTTTKPNVVCAALGTLKISHQEGEFNRVENIVKGRIKDHNFNISASSCQYMALRAMMAYQLR